MNDFNFLNVESKDGLLMRSSGYCTITGNTIISHCDRCGKTEEHYPNLRFEMVPTRRAFASYKNPEFARLLVGEKVFEMVCSECFMSEDQRKLEQFNNEFDLRNKSSMPKGAFTFKEGM